MRRSASLRSLAVLSIAGCATVDPRPDYDRAREEIRASTGAQEIHDPDAPLLSAEEIRAILADGLRLGEATRLALLNNRRLQAGFLALGVARSEFVQAGLLENPSLSLAFLFPDPGGRVRWTADLLGSVAEIWQIPSRQALARAGLEQRILELSRSAGELVAATKEAYFEGVAARQARSIARANVELARRSLAAVRRQVEEGVASRTDEGLAESLALGAELSFRRTEREEVGAVRQLAALLSIEEDVLAVSLADPLPEPALGPVEREELVERSQMARADVRAAERAVAAAEEKVALERRRRFGLGAGASAERPEGGSSADLLVGPAVAVEIPLFDRNQAQVSRAEFELRERMKEREALSAEVRQAVRAATDKAAVAARAAAFARDELVPQAERSASLAEKAYRLGDTTVLALLQAQRVALEARRTEIEALLEAALSRIDLERAAGSPLGEPRGR
ncbi:MAG: TolC family protein [Planctomycetes bacterium]|nr:TolC family protein [Planctomycetota bacterium]